MPHGHAELGESTPQSIFYDQGRFGRLFPSLPPFAADTKLIRDALAELGAPGGPMDPGDDLSDPITLITDPAKSVNNPDNPTSTAGFTFFGQFLDHDMTFDPTSSLARTAGSRVDSKLPHPGARPRQPLRQRTGGITAPVRPERRRRPDDAAGGDHPRLGGRVDRRRRPFRPAPQQPGRRPHRRSPQRREPHRLPVPPGSDSLPQPCSGRRAAPSSAPRSPPRRLFTEAQRVVSWHYQWLVLHEFLPHTVGDDVTASVLQDGLQHFHWRNDPFIPVEFSVAAYRFGHSQVRPSYRANFGTSATDVDAAVLRPHLRRHAALRTRSRRPARRAAERRGVSSTGRRSSTSATGGCGATRSSTPSCRRCCSTLLGQPVGDPVSLATRNLLRNLTMQVPSGQRIAQAMQLPVLARVRPGRPGAIPPPQADATVVLHPARGPRDGRGPPPRSRRRSYRGRSHRRPDPR